MSIQGTLQRIYSEFGGRRLTYDEAAKRLERSGERLSARMRRAAARPWNLRQAKHVIGIERWGQRRLRTLLGEPLIMDEYDGYRPDDLNDMAALSEAFAATRRDTLALVESLRAAGVDLTQTVPHNEFGDLSVRGWLFYLDNHATRETWLL